jgi:hypothetical protein
MREPAERAKPDGTPVGSFKAFLRRHRALGALPAPTPAPKRLAAAPRPNEAPKHASIAALKLSPTKPDGSGELSLDEATGALAALKHHDGYVSFRRQNGYLLVLPPTPLAAFENDSSVFDRIVGTSRSEKPAMKLHIASKARL